MAIGLIPKKKWEWGLTLEFESEVSACYAEEIIINKIYNQLVPSWKEIDQQDNTIWLGGMKLEDTDYLLDELKKYKIQFTFERIT